MAITAHYYTKFDSGKFYHIYNRSVDKMPMFKSEDNYQFFLKQYDHYLSNVLDTYAYCLLGNHFHLLVRVQDLATFEKLSNLKVQHTEEESNIHKIVAHQFQKLFQSYAMAFNKQQGRSGTLFQTPFKRVLVDTDEYFTQMVYYIHANPQRHGLINDFRDWKWSSYSSLLTDKPTKLKKPEVLQWFGNVNRYKEYHSLYRKEIIGDDYFLEDDIG